MNKTESVINEALSATYETILNRENELNLTDDEIQMLEIALDTAMQESQLPDIGERGYEDVFQLKSKLGILRKEDFYCEKCRSAQLKYSLYRNSTTISGKFLCKKCGSFFIDWNCLMATKEDWDDFKCIE